MNKFIYNEEMYQWERVDRVQEYRGVQIETLTIHNDYYDPKDRVNHREYRVTYPSGKIIYTRINKRPGGNINDLKSYIDFKIKYNEQL